MRYTLKADTPDRVIRLWLEDDAYTAWAALSSAARKQEEFRKATILRGAYLVDRAILPEGKPARLGDSWYIPAHAFGDVMALRTDRRMKDISGSLHFKRDQNQQYDGKPHANISMRGRGLDNRIHLSTHPKKTEETPEETTELVLLPDAAEIYWDLHDRKVSQIELVGKAEAVRKHNNTFPWSDKELTVQPEFDSLYQSKIRTTNFYEDSEAKEVIRKLMPLLRLEFSDHIVDAIEQQLN